jgi:N-acetylneuraminic acid mutarotase
MRRPRSVLRLLALSQLSATLACSCASAPTSTPPVTGEQGDAGAATAPKVAADDPTRFVSTGKLSQARFGHTATLLPDGRVVVVGGETTAAPALAIQAFDPATGEWTTLADLPSKRENHTTTLLADGRLLVVGGGKSSEIGAPAGAEVLDTTLLVDPLAGSVTGGPGLHAARSHHTATRLADGRVVVIGGATNTHGYQSDFGDALGTVEIFDPKTNAWTDAASVKERRFLHTASVLGSGHLVVLGGSDETERELPVVESFDPTTGAWTTSPSLAESRVFHATAQLDDGSIFVTTGKLANKRFLGTSEILDPSGGAWSAAPDLKTSRTAAALAKLASGRLLLAGGLHGSLAGFEALDEAHIYDPTTRTWSAISAMKSKRRYHSSTTLQDGRVLLCGGVGSDDEPLATCELAVP